MLKGIKKLLKKNHLIDGMAYLVYDSIEKNKSERRKKQELKKAMKEPLYSLSMLGNEFLVLNEDKIESLPLVEIYKLIEGGECKVKIPKQSIWEINNAQVFNNSDIILTERGAIWNKYYDKQRFEMTIYGDGNVIDVKDDYVYLKKYNMLDKIKIGFSLCGVHDAVWAHFLLLFLPKLYVAEELLSYINDEITVLMPKTNDNHINGLVNSFIKHHNQFKVVYLDKEEGIECEKLFYVNDLNYIMEHSYMTTMASGYFSKYSAELLKRNIDKEYMNIVKEKNLYEEPIKLFLERNTNWSCMKNQSEVKEYFEREKFIIIEPHKLNLNEKIFLFQSAECVVGPSGSAFTNVLFCKPGTQILVFAPYTVMQQNPWAMSYYDKYWGTKTTYICGEGENTDTHGDYTVPLEKIREVYEKIERGE